MTSIGWTGRSPRLRLRGRWAGVRPGLLPLESRIVPATFTVNSFTDGADAHIGGGTALTNDGRITLRSAIQEINASGVAGTVIVPAGSYTLSILGSNEDNAATGDLDLLVPIAVKGAGSATTTIIGDGSDRIFDVHTNQSVDLDKLTLTGGHADVGGAVRSDGGSNLTFNDVVLRNNQSTGNGGAIAGIAPGPHGQLNLNDVYLQNNTAGGDGGAIFADGETVVIKGATLAGNSAAGDGGGLAVVDTQLTQLGGAQITQATFSGNTAGVNGGAVDVGANTIVQATDSTFTLNHAGDFAGGIYAVNPVGGSGNAIVFGLGNVIVAGNTAASGIPDVAGPVNTQGFNLIGDGTEASGFNATDQVGTATAPINPLLSPLILRGGNLPVQVPAPGSPALNRGSSFNIADERGVTRPSSGQDVGAVEAQAFGISTTSNGEHATGGTAFATLKAVVTEGGQPLPGAVVTFTAPTGGASGTFADSPPILTDASGIASAPTFTANFTPGSYSVRASASATLSTNIALTNDPALTDVLVVTLGPGPYQAGDPFQLTVTALTPAGIRDTAYTGTVSFATDAAAQGSLPFPTTFGTADAGQKTFQVILGGLGSHVISVTDPTGPAGNVTVLVTPVTNRFFFSAPDSVTEGQPFSVVIFATDSNGNPLPSFVGPVTLSSNDPHATLPTNIVFTAADQGAKTISGLVLWPPGPDTITATAADGTTGSTFAIGVIDLGPSNLTIQTDHDSIPEGGTVTLTGSFTNLDPLSTHTVDIQWSGAPDTHLALGPGVFNFKAQQTYTGVSTPGSPFEIFVTVTDEAGPIAEARTDIAVTNVAPQLPTGGLVLATSGSPIDQTIPFNDPGNDNFTATADYGDGTGPQPVQVNDHSLLLDHSYKTEGTYPVTVTLLDGNGGSATLNEQLFVFLPGTSDLQYAVVPVNDTETISIPGAIVTLHNLGGTTTALLTLGRIDPNSLTGLTGSPSADPTTLVSSFDIRVLAAGPDSVLTAQLTYPSGAAAADPSVLYYDKSAGAFVAVKGSTKVANSFVVDKTAHTATFVLGNTSTPTVAGLGGTVFTLSVPAPAAVPTPTSNSGSSSVNTGTSPFFLASAAPASAALAGLDLSVATPIPTTGLVSSSTLTVAVSAAEGLVRGGGDEPLAARLVNPQTLSTVIESAVEIGDFLKEAFRMWIDQPAPMEAPAALLPPPDLHNQIQLREITADVAAKSVAAAPPTPADPNAISLTAPTLPAQDVVIAPAETRPWWLTAAPERAETPTGDDAIPMEHVPTTAERVSAAVQAVWLGGAALAAVVPESRVEDEKEWLPPPSEEDEEVD